MTGFDVPSFSDARPIRRRRPILDRAHAIFTRERLIVSIVLTASVAALYFTAPKDDDFWWFDAPVHAMNGVFVHDFLAAMPIADPVGFAERYFTVYPALSILFYPPLFYAAEAALFGLFGVHHWVAQLTVSLFTAAFAAGVFALCRRRLSPWTACAAVLLAFTMPGIALWSRQIMLELPACALIVWSAHWFVRYLEEQRPLCLHIAVVLLVLALYTKQTVIFIGAVGLVAIVLKLGPRFVLRREIWTTAVLAGVLLLPLGVITLLFGRFNIEQAAVGVSSDLPPVPSLAAFAWYAKHMPTEIGWIPAALAALFVVRLLTVDRVKAANPFFLFLLLWLGIGYLFFSLVHYKDARHMLPIYVPIAVFAAASLEEVVRRARLPAAGAVVVSVVLFAGTLAWSETPRVTGHKEAAAFVSALTEPGARIMFHGHRSGTFIFAMRELATNRPPITTLRAEKFLVEYRIDRRYGIKDLERSKQEIERIFETYAVRYVVFQTGFWTDLESIAAFEDVLRSDRFAKIAEFPIGGAEKPASLVVFKYKGPLSDTPAPVVIDVPAIGRKIGGN